MKKILLALLAVLLLTGSSFAAVGISGNIQAYFYYNNDVTPKYALGLYRVTTILDAEVLDNVSGRILLRPDLVSSAESIINEVYFVVGDFLVSNLTAKAGLLETSFVSYNKNLMLYPKTYDARHRAGAVQLTYDWDMVKLEGALCNSGTGFSAGTEGAKSLTLRATSDKLLSGLFVGVGYKNIANVGERVGTLSATAQYKFEQFILDGEYVGQMSGTTKPTDWFVSLGYSITDDLLASIRYEGLKDQVSGLKSELSGGIKYQYRPNLAGIIEVANDSPESGSSTTTFYLGAIYTY